MREQTVEQTDGQTGAAGPGEHADVPGSGGGVRQRVDFWFDPVCPWAWMASRWMDQVQTVRPVEVSWHVMSLSVLNQGRDLDPDYARMMDDAWLPVRVVVAAREQFGDTIVKPLYDAIGTRIHPGGERDYRVAVAGALAALDLPPELLAHGDDDRHDDLLRASHQDGIRRVGEDVGTPVVAIGEVAFFGPVVTPAPKGEAAGRLWDGCVLVAGTPGFFELKRSRTEGPRFD